MTESLVVVAAAIMWLLCVAGVWLWLSSIRAFARGIGWYTLFLVPLLLTPLGSAGIGLLTLAYVQSPLEWPGTLMIYFLVVAGAALLGLIPVVLVRALLALVGYADRGNGERLVDWRRGRLRTAEQIATDLRDSVVRGPGVLYDIAAVQLPGRRVVSGGRYVVQPRVRGFGRKVINSTLVDLCAAEPRLTQLVAELGRDRVLDMLTAGRSRASVYNRYVRTLVDEADFCYLYDALRPLFRDAVADRYGIMAADLASHLIPRTSHKHRVDVDRVPGVDAPWMGAVRDIHRYVTDHGTFLRVDMARSVGGRATTREVLRVVRAPNAGPVTAIVEIAADLPLDRPAVIAAVEQAAAGEGRTNRLVAGSVKLNTNALKDLIRGRDHVRPQVTALRAPAVIADPGGFGRTATVATTGVVNVVVTPFVYALRAIGLLRWPIVAVDPEGRERVIDYRRGRKSVIAAQQVVRRSA
ncbi:hypothetical protein SAMN04488550_4398 [Gordonia malaquae]|uniref:Uncharacterized protein n=1 Tax=Gordonia malaquae NBRC 108250 TaxID=1223542 RepID=M3UUV9_GORML|nr:hypothetical protein [Gordonia malaquae]GAC79242.1 hypothetical protein GM1_008_00040 [Gordonia malaquae NBRC 108250]SEE37006.1 hypothetical protein SAMN04488550_4398 [Gordonia malaquae]